MKIKYVMWNIFGNVEEFVGTNGMTRQVVCIVNNLKIKILLSCKSKAKANCRPSNVYVCHLEFSTKFF